MSVAASNMAADHFDPGELVWFDPGVGYSLPGEVVEFSAPAGVVIVQAIVAGQPKPFTLHNLQAVRRREDLGPDGVQDMIAMSDLCEASILWNLKVRYDRQHIYTNIGSILLAVNPYRLFDIYGVDAVKRYEGQILGSLPAHIFATASAAYQKLNKGGSELENQVVVISGESGSGKTESTKLILRYLAAVNRSASNLVTEQILEASPLLEAFGNAKTVKNDNSSRFGKYMQVFFNDGVITGARTIDYLLEKSRIVTQAQDERNYHVFYELLAGLSDQEKEKYGLQTADKYFYLNQGGSIECGSKNDVEDFRSLLAAIQVLGLSSEETDVIFRILAAVLHLGNVYFHRKPLKHGTEGVDVGSEAEVRWASHLLQTPAEGILRSLTTKATEARGERLLTPLNIDQALDARDAIAKALYSTLFSWLVKRVNAIVYKGPRRACIAILDIFGFESLQENSFEQLCINYANENLHSYLNRHVFKLEQAEYAKERIEWIPLAYPDNQAVISLIAKKPVGILHLLDDESNFPKASDVSYLEKCHYNHALNELYSRPRMSSLEFGIRHYAGQVWYSVDGFLDKNRDTLRPDVTELLIASKITMISKMFLHSREQLQQDGHRGSRHDGGRFVTMKPRAPTVAARFHDSLQALVDQMAQCNPWFIRCLKPNAEKIPMRLDMPLVLEQIRYSGILDTVRIRKTGYPIRFKFSQFADRYQCLISQKTLGRAAPPRDICQRILEQFSSRQDNYQLGQSKVFLREPLEQHLDRTRANRIRSAVITIQKHIRGYLARQRYDRIKLSAVKIQSAYRGYAQRRKYLKVRRGVVRVQANWRMKLALRSFRRLQESVALKREAERRAREAERERVEREEREREKRERATFQHLEIPPELQLALNNIDDWQCPQGERNIVKANERPQRRPRRVIGLPADIDSHVFSKFTNIYFKSHQWGLKKEPITTPFLAKAHDQDNHDSVAIFKLILRFMYDPNLTGKRERLLGDYIVQRGLARPSLRDEILCQLTTQTCNNPDAASRNRCWLLMANCLSCFPPSRTLYKYLLKYVSDHAAVDNYACHCQRLLLRIGAMDAKLARTYPPSLLEWRNNANRFQIGLEAHTYDQMTDPLDSGAPATIIEAHSWSSGQDFATDMLHARGIEESHSFGWSTDLIEENGNIVYSLNGADYLMDLISETEIAPGFDTCKSYYLVSCDRSRPMEKSLPLSTSGPHDPERYNVYEADIKELPPLPANPPPANRQVARGKTSTAKTPQPAPPVAMGRKALHHMSTNALGPAAGGGAYKKNHMTPSRSRSMDDLLDGDEGSVVPPPLSKRSALNDRYFEVRRSHQQLSTHNDSVVSHDDLQSDADDDVLPLSTKSRLNQRYLSQQAGYQGHHQQGEMADGRSSSIPDISELSPIMNAGGERPHPAWQRKLGLSASALNERYFDDGSTGGADDGARGSTGSMPVTEQTIEPQHKFARDRPPAARPDYRYPPHPKSKRSAQAPGPALGSGSQSSRATRVGPGEYTRSSAMSDCSEAPSLASHVRHVKVPSHTADLDQYLDELFNPVLDGDDGLSDARSLAASLKGRQRDFDDDSLIEAMSDPVRLSRKIKGMILDDDQDSTSDPPPPPPPPMPTPAQLGLSSLSNSTTTLQRSLVPLDQPLEVQTASLSFDDDEVLSLAEDSIGMMWQDPVALSARIKGVTQAVEQQGAMSGAGVQGLPGLNPGAAAFFGFGAPGQRTQGPSSPGSNGGATTSNSNGSNPAFYNLPLYNVSGMTVPIVDASQLIQQQVLQQHMMQMQQRAFLASAVQQNLQIQQQLMQQSAALQQLLQSSVIGGASSPGQSAEEGLQSIQSTTSAPANLQKGLFPSGLNLMSPLLLSQSPGVGQDLSTHSVPAMPTQAPIGKLRKFSDKGGAASDSSSTSSSNKSNFQNVLSELKMKAGNSGPPDPPLSPTSAKKRAADLYGRAKTIRIGKWRWPPPRDDKGNCIPAPGQPTSFSEFKRLKREAKKQAKRDAGLAGPDDDDIEVSSSDDEKYMHGNPYSQMNAATGSGDSALKSSGTSNKDDIIKAFEGRSRPDPGSIGKIRISNEMKSKLEQLTIDHSVRSKSSSAKGSPGSAVSAFKQLNDERKNALERQLQGWSDNQGHKWTDGRAQPRTSAAGAGTESDAESFHVDNLVKNKIKKMERVSQQINERGIHPIGNGEQASTNSSGKSYGYDDNSDPDSPVLAQNKKNQRNQLGPPPPPPGGEKKQTSEYEDVKETSTPLIERSNRPPVQQPQTQTKLFPLPQTSFLMYTNTRWELRIRKEVFSPAETLNDPKATHLIFAQVVREVIAGTTIRLTLSEICQLRSLLSEFGVTESNVNAAAAHKPHVKKAIIEQCRKFPNYFARIFPVSTGAAGQRQNRSGNHLPELLGVSHSGLRLLRRDRDASNGREYLRVLDTIAFDNVVDVSLARVSTVQLLLRDGGLMTLYSPKAPHIHSIVERFVREALREGGGSEFVRALADYVTSENSLLSFRRGDIIRLLHKPASHVNVPKGWLFGALDTGDTGLFPIEYVGPLQTRNGHDMAAMHHSWSHAEHNKDETRTPTSREVRRIERSEHQNLPKRSPLTEPNGIDPLHEHIGSDNEFDVVGDLNAGGPGGLGSPIAGPLEPNGKFSMLQFAVFNFRESLEKYDVLRDRENHSIRGSIKMLELLKQQNKQGKKKSKKKAEEDSDWTWSELTELVKFSKSPLHKSLLPLESTELNKVAVDCFIQIMRYMGDYPMAKGLLEVDCVYSILSTLHKYPMLHDEVYCQLIKQCTSNKSSKLDSCQKGWRLLSIVTAYFDCSDNLRPYLFHFLETAAFDNRRAFHGTAMVCLHNLRKTFRYGGRKNVPSIEEIAAISAGRNSKRQMYRLPGGTERVINTRSTTVVDDIIEDICSVLGVTDPLEMEEFSLYCIVEGDPFTMPLSRDEYILDVTTELLKNDHVFYLIFCRSVWYYNLRLDNQLYIEVIFNQVAPDYLEGLLLVTEGDELPEGAVQDIARIAALLHRAANMQHTPTKDEVKYLLPKPVLPMKDIKPPQWVESVQQHWPQALTATTTEAKAECLAILQQWPLFGSCFFNVKWMRSESTANEQVLALNREGIHFLDVQTHNTVWMQPFSEVISTRKVQAEDGTLFLDMKCGNLMQQKITRIQTEQAHEISRLVRQYINIEQGLQGRGGPGGQLNAMGTQNMTLTRR
ncbi:unconventional myosin-XV-like isoform X2 [Varroa destructor]|uniref:Unconventional myosin-XV n=1 Tax=Varroa destructor TaxID=109461 RepID=A0A7M7MDN8_VARDE|nr:unconventional myosin-XV-like isoform X2 [Varroa destructor]